MRDVASTCAWSSTLAAWPVRERTRFRWPNSRILAGMETTEYIQHGVSREVFFATVETLTIRNGMVTKHVKSFPQMAARLRANPSARDHVYEKVLVAHSGMLRALRGEPSPSGAHTMSRSIQLLQESKNFATE